jgi:hypothetical protein
MNRFVIILIVLFLSMKPGVCEKFGVGIIIGSPTGFTAKYVITSRSGISGHIGWSLGDNPRLHIVGDYQFLFPVVLHWTDEASGEQKELKGLTPYIGIGGRLVFKENEPENKTELNIGMRLGGGAEYEISRFGIFLEVYPVINVLPSTDFDLEGGLGARIYF